MGSWNVKALLNTRDTILLGHRYRRRRIHILDFMFHSSWLDVLHWTGFGLICRAYGYAVRL
jgi:hypothetical protein